MAGADALADQGVGPLLTAEGLRVSSASGDILRGVDLRVDRGEVVGVVGESGCGKTTLGLAILGLLGRSRSIAAGEIRLDDETIGAPGVDRTAPFRGARLSFVPQDPFRSFDPLRRMGPQVRRPLELHRDMASAEADERVIGLLDRLGVPEPADVMQQYPHQLSGGMLQRAAIATALSCEPELIIADEPTTALDALVQVQVIESFMALVQELGTSVLVITHELRLLERMADRIAAMYAGRIVEFGPTHRLLEAPRHPYPAALLESSVRTATPGQRLVTVEGQPPSLPGTFLPCAFAPRCARADERCRSEEPHYPWPADAAVACHHPIESERMIGPTIAPASIRESRPWGLRIGVGLLLLLAILVVAGPLVWTNDPTFESIEGLGAFGEPLDAGTEGYPLGTDHKGRDLAARLLYAGRLTLLTAIVSVAIATVAGLLVGMLASSTRGFAGSVLMRFTDIGLAIPGLLLAAAIATILGRGTLGLVVGLAAVFWAPIARVTYGQAVVLRERDYVEAARVQGASSTTVLARHILPHLLPVVGAYAALSVGWAVLFELALGFLGAGVQEPQASIGSMLGNHLIYYRSHPGLILFPAVFLGVLVVAANLVGESLRTRTEER